MMTESDKHTSLLRYGINYGPKMLYIACSQIEASVAEKKLKGLRQSFFSVGSCKFDRKRQLANSNLAKHFSIIQEFLTKR